MRSENSLIDEITYMRSFAKLFSSTAIKQIQLHTQTQQFLFLIKQPFIFKHVRLLVI